MYSIAQNVMKYK